MGHVQTSGVTARRRQSGGWSDGAALGGKPRWYLPLALLTDTAGALPVALGLSRGDASGGVAQGCLAVLAWPAVRLCRARCTGRALGESRGALPVLYDWLVLAGVLAVLRTAGGLPRPSPLTAAALSVPLVLTLVCQKGLYRHLAAARREAHAVVRVVVLGEPAAADELTARLSARTDHPYIVVGTVALGAGALDRGAPVAAQLPGHRAGGGADDAARVLAAVRAREADLVVLCPGIALPGGRLRRLCWALHDAGLGVALAPGLLDVAVKRLRAASAGGAVLLRIAPPVRHGAQVALKGALDRVGALVGLLVLGPLLLAIALVVRLSSPGPALYRHERIGRHGVPFTMWKFRTMHRDAAARRRELADRNEQDGPLFKIRRDPRVTRVGRVLRRTSLDELPQLVNVVRGDMSLVGPRPPLPDEVARYTSVEHRRLLVRPGITGLWQVSGRSDLSWDEAVRLDLDYVDNWSFTSDIDVMARTLRAVLDSRGAY